MPEDEKKSLIDDLNMMQEEIENAAQDLPEWEDKQRRESSLLREKFIKVAVKNPIDNLRHKYKGHKQVGDFLKAVQKTSSKTSKIFCPTAAMKTETRAKAKTR